MSFIFLSSNLEFRSSFLPLFLPSFLTYLLTYLLIYLLDCVCVCLFVFISCYCKGFSWLNKTINVMLNQVSDNMQRKYFCVKNLCRHVIGNHSRNLQASNCAKEFQLMRARPQEIKDNSNKLSRNQQLKRET